MKQIFIYVQHLLGTGHLRRVEVIADCLADNGLAVTVASGGVDEPRFEHPGVTTIRLPGIQSDAAFSGLYDTEGKVVTDSLMEQRLGILGPAFSAIKPEMLIIESYPFARRQMRKEILALLEIAREQNCGQTLIACSVRDIVQPKSKRERIDEIVDLVDRYFDYVLVHGDEEFIPFDRSFPQCSKFQDRIIYTGYISRPYRPDPELHRNPGSIVVSAGGGAAGKLLYECVLEAAKSRTGKNYSWLVLVGNSLDNAYLAELKRQEEAHISVERNRTDFRDLLSRCACSVSQGGYNTVMDLLATNTPAVIIPFEGEGEVEQLTRAQALQQRNRVRVLRERQLDSSRLLESIEICCRTDPARNRPIVNLQGAEMVYKTVAKALSLY